MLNNTNKKSIMKKYFIIAAAAVVAMASCAKDEILFDETAPSNKIGFEVANYARQTKANASLTNSEDGIYSFHTYAYQFPKIGDPRVFMSETIYAWQEATQENKLTSGEAPVAVWAPETDYYWPKTGYINFYSYAGTHTPTQATAAAAADQDMTTISLTFENAVIDATSNILVADAALHQGRTNYQDNAYEVDDDGNGDDVTKGVPTLFRHQLAKIIVDVEARTTDEKKSKNTIWKVQVLSANGTGNDEIKSEIIPINKGSLALTNTDDATAAGTKVWTKTNESSTNISGWVPSSTSTDKENISLSNSDVLTIAANTTGDGTQSVILAARSVMPQLTSNVGFTLVYKVQALHGTTVYLEEIRTVGIDAAAAIGDLASTVTSWQANKKITYHIIIDPVSEKVTFDPAVEAYDEIDADGDVDDININEGGIVVPQP